MIFIPAPLHVQSLRVANSNLHPLSEVVVSWAKPNGGNEIESYNIVWYHFQLNGRQSLLGSKYYHHISNEINFTSTITNLQPGIQYEVKIRAVNSQSYSPYISTYIATGKSNFLITTSYK